MKYFKYKVGKDENPFLIRHHLKFNEKYSIYIHKILRGEAEMDFHNHPYDFISFIILVGMKNHILMAYMKKADLSISLTGYNTTMNILRTGVRSLVAPIGHYSYDKEQLVRTQKLESLGIVEVLDPENLEPSYIAQKIIDCLDKNISTKANHVFDLQGAEKTGIFLKELLQESIAVAA
ncbi:MAG: hypothetical protein HC820_03855 [Hydrococcus sp. RM1_1_31]|nr:hypothetical protein [Hydrococcus sp. RM1_1_31]